MKLLKSFLLASGASLALAVAVQAADLTTNKTSEPPPQRPNCLASVWTWLDCSPKDCPFSAYGFTFYGSLDLDAGWASSGSRFNPDLPSHIQIVIADVNNKSRWQLVPGGLGVSNFGLKCYEPLAPGRAIVGDVNAGFDPHSLHFSSAPQALADNTFRPLGSSSSNMDSSRAYGIINGRAEIGVSNTPFGTLTFGRQTFSTDNANYYDPFGGAYAFSLIGGTENLVKGMGLPELGRITDSFKYVWSNNNFRVGVIGGLGGFDSGNNAGEQIQFDVGGDFGRLSKDVMYQYAEYAAQLFDWYIVPTPAGNIAGERLRAEESAQPSLRPDARRLANRRAFLDHHTKRHARRSRWLPWWPHATAHSAQTGARSPLRGSGSIAAKAQQTNILRLLEKHGAK